MAKTTEDLDAIRRYLNKLEETKRLEETAREEFMDRRYCGNLNLVAELEKEVKEHPELRFGQILFLMFSDENHNLDPNKIFAYEPDELNNLYQKNKERWQKM